MTQPRRGARVGSTSRRDYVTARCRRRGAFDPRGGRVATGSPETRVTIARKCGDVTLPVG